MNMRRRWDRCISHRGDETMSFIRSFFADEKRRTFLIGGAGFDPRARVVCEALAGVMDNRITAFFIREERPGPAEEMVKRADENLGAMMQMVQQSDVAEIDIFASDGAVVGGRAAIQALLKRDLGGFSDIVVDFSALSIGIAFPLVRHLYELLRRNDFSFNLHLMVTDEPSTDEQVELTANDTVEMIFGFKGGWGLYDTNDAARLWVPQLSYGCRSALERIHAFIDPHDVCPVLPFPAAHPRSPDKLVEHYIQELESAWNVDVRNIVHADEKKPLDLYRTIRIDDARRRVFDETGGSLVILSPIGSKVLAIGALMAAIERDFPVAHTEAIAYTVDFKKLDENRLQRGDLAHVWLCGEAYTPYEQKQSAHERRYE